ncbi:MAG: hypothetical protein M3R08_00650 [Bacteroidota bacterium]|nr:hypothetical protein [Bacteroidota bacterium]
MGMWTFPLAIFGPEHFLIPGDLGDARFNNYILEHFHLFASGKLHSYWDAPFMYPWPNLIAHSDNLLGTAPIYSFIRSIGFNRESAFQAWILVLFALNYWCCLLALNAWSRRLIVSACGAFIFAFGIYSIGQMDHAQVYPRFMIPVAFYFTWRSLESGRPLFLLLAMLTIVYQFYCGIYLGFMLMYALFFLMLSYLIIHRTSSSLFWIKEPRSWSIIGVIGLGGAALLLPLMLPYVQVSKVLGVRQFHEVVASIPRPVSYFFTHPAALSWRDLSGHSKFAFPDWWSHFLFVGGTLWFALIAAIPLVFTKMVDIDRRKHILTIGLGILLSTIFCMNFETIIPYKVIFQLPGFSALRAMDRMINVQIMFFILMFTLVAGAFAERSKWSTIMAIALPVLVIVDNRIDVSELKRFDKWQARAMVDEIERYMTAQLHEGYKAIAYTPLLAVIEPELVHDRTITMNLTAMLAAQQIGRPIVNAYTGSYPPNYMDFFDHMDDRSLDRWCEYNGIDKRDIQQINDLQLPFRSTEIASLQMGNGKFICSNSQKNGVVLADKDVPKLWETYRVVHFDDDRIALRAHNGSFLSFHPEHSTELRASAPLMGDGALFKMEPIDEEWFHLKTMRGEYLILDTINHTVWPIDRTPGSRDQFRFAATTFNSP